MPTDALIAFHMGVPHIFAVLSQIRTTQTNVIAFDNELTSKAREWRVDFRGERGSLVHTNTMKLQELGCSLSSNHMGGFEAQNLL